MGFITLINQVEITGRMTINERQQSDLIYFIFSLYTALEIILVWGTDEFLHKLTIMSVIFEKLTCYKYNIFNMK